MILYVVRCVVCWCIMRRWIRDIHVAFITLVQVAYTGREGVRVRGDVNCFMICYRGYVPSRVVLWCTHGAAALEGVKPGSVSTGVRGCVTVGVVGMGDWGVVGRGGVVDIEGSSSLGTEFCLFWDLSSREVSVSRASFRVASSIFSSCGCESTEA